MFDLYIFAGLGLLIGGIALACATRTPKPKSKSKPNCNNKSTTPPPLPARRTTPAQNRPRAPVATPKSQITRPTRPTCSSNLGPRGIRPDQFPCCPIDKQRNIPGAPQRIFWDSTTNRYRCSHGHEFQANGKL